MEAPSSSALLLGQLHTRRGGLAPYRPGWPASRLLLRVFKSSCPDGILLPPKPIRTPGTGKEQKCRAQSELPTARPGTHSVCGRSLCGDSPLRHHHSSSGPQSLSSHREEGAWIPHHWLQRRPRVLGRDPWGAGLDLPPPQSAARKPERRWDSSA